MYTTFEAMENKKICTVVAGLCPSFLILQKYSFQYSPFSPKGHNMNFVEAYVTSNVLEGFLVPIP